FREVDSLEVAERDRWHDLERHGVVEIDLAGDQLFNHAFVGRQRHLGIRSELVAALTDNLIIGVANGRVDDFGHGRTTVHTLEMGDRYLARTKSINSDTALQLVEARIDLGIQLRGTNDDLVLALKSFGKLLGNWTRPLYLSLHLHRRRSPLNLAPVGLKAEDRGLPRIGAGGGTRTPTTFATGT